jgi:hypothetical protein
MPSKAKRHRLSMALVSAVSVLLVGASACTSKGTPTASSATLSAEPTTASTANGATATATLTWRGATVKPPSGWGKGLQEETSLCLARKPNPDRYCHAMGGTNDVQDWVYLYASERSGGAEGEPAHSSTLDGSDMGFWMYDSGTLPCDATDGQQVKKGIDTIGGRSASYGKWQVSCKNNGRNFTVQRWLLPKSRLGVVSFAVTSTSEADIYQMITTMDLSGFKPTSPR